MKPNADNLRGMLVTCLERRKSTLAGAGLGVFATERIGARKLIGRYNGRIMQGSSGALTIKEYNSSQKYTGERYDYVMIDGETLIDGWPGNKESNWVACINSMKTKDQAKHVNIRIIGFDEARAIASHKAIDGVWYVTKRAIREGEELICDYGPSYWTDSELTD